MGTESFSPLSILTPSIPSTQSEEDPPNPTTSLLSPRQSPPKSNTLLFTALILTTSIALASSIAFAFLYFSSSSSSLSPRPQISPLLVARPLSKLPNPTVILISSDGFRFGYQFKTHTPNIARLIANGTEAETGLIPVFPSLTFPNHYSIATGLYPTYHGIINNQFIDPASGDLFTMASHEPKWWLGEPIWETVVNHGMKAATFFWPGSEVHKGIRPEDVASYFKLCTNRRSSKNDNLAKIKSTHFKLEETAFHVKCSSIPIKPTIWLKLNARTSNWKTLLST